MSKNLRNTLMKPFIERDEISSGVLVVDVFLSVLKDLGVMLSYQDMLTVALYFVIKGQRAPSAYPSSHLDHLASFRNAKLSGSLMGAAKTSPLFGNFLSENGIGLMPKDPDLSEVQIEYARFVNDLSEVLSRLIERNGGIATLGGRYPWVLREFEFIDALIVQLEAMKSSQRRRVLMSLQYALSAADPNQV